MLFKFLRPAVLLCALAGTFNLSAAEEDNMYWRPYLDQPMYSYWQASTGFVLPAKTNVPEWDDLGIWELSGWGYLYYQENELGGDLDIKAKVDMQVLNGFDGVSSGYPLTMARLSLRYAQRYIDGYGAQFIFEPGLYSGMEQFSGKDFAWPFGIIGTRALSPESAVQLGLNIYPGFDQVVDPVLGYRWTRGQIDVGPVVTLDLGYPETRIEIRTTPAASFEAGIRIRNWPEYQMGKDDERERVSYDETRLWFGTGLALNEAVTLNLEVGYTLDRELAFEKAADPISIDDAGYFRIGLSGRF